MLKSLFSIWVLLLSGSFPLAASGDYSVGFGRMQTLVAETNEAISIVLVYPTHSPASPVRFGPFLMNLAMDAEIADGRFPLAIISHGSGGSSLNYRSIAFALVKRGFIVGLPLHPKDNFENNTAAGTADNWINRPKHIKATLDALLANPVISSSIERAEIAVIGHSAGGYTALAVAGGSADTRHLINLCRTEVQLNEPFCARVHDNQVKPVNINNPPDERVKAVVLLAPVGILFKSEASLVRVKLPVLLLRAEKDRELTEPYHSALIAANIANPQQLTYRTISNAGHFSFLTPFPQAARFEPGAVAMDPEGFDREAFHQTLGTDIASFLLDAMR